VRWASGDAVMSYFNPYDQPLVAELRLQLMGVSPRLVTLEHEGRPVAEARTGEQAVELALTRLELAPGVNQFKLRSSEPAQRLGTGRYQLRSFGLRESSIQVTVPAGRAARPAPPAGE
jgi:hypothetical protein